MLELADRPANEALDGAVAAALASLYTGLAHCEPHSVRAYRGDDAMLVLLRFDPLALPDLVVAAVRERTGERLLAGSLSVSVERGLAVLGFSIPDEDAPLVVEMSGLDSGLRLAG